VQFFLKWNLQRDWHKSCEVAYEVEHHHMACYSPTAMRENGIILNVAAQAQPEAPDQQHDVEHD